MSAGNLYVKLFYRVFPSEEPTWDFIKIKEKKTIYARKLQEFTNTKKQKLKFQSQTGFWEFTTDGVFYNSTQTIVYASVAEDLLSRLEKGCNAVIVAFGQTGTGKSFTLGGLELTEQDLGVIPQLLHGLFDRKKILPNNLKMSIQMSFVEFTPTTSIDLLREPPSFLETCENRNATRIKVKSRSHALELLYLGEGRREVIETEHYSSHVNTSAVTIHIVVKNVEFTDPFKITSRFHIIDMAGCDVPGKASCSFKSRSHVAKANLTKMSMEQFFLCLMSKTMICDKLKQRMNPLLYYLDGDLVMQSEIRFIGHIKINREDLPITLSMLRFGQFVKGYTPTHRNMLPEQNDDIKLQLLEHELERMKKEKMQDSVLLNQNLSLNLNQDRMEHIERLVKDYMKSGVNEISILNVAEASVVFKVFKDLVRQCEAEKRMKGKDTTKVESGSIRSKESLLPPRKPSKSSTSMDKKSSTLLKKALKKPPSISRHADKGISVQSFLAYQLETLALQTPAGTLKKAGQQSKTGARSKHGRRGSPAQLTKARSGSKPGKSIASETSFDKIGSLMDFVPESIPENSEVWEKYSEEPMYRSLYEDYRMNEILLRDSYKEYLERMKKLQEIKDLVEDRRNDLREAKMFKKFSVFVQSGTTEHAISKETVLNEAEEMCESELRNKVSEMQRQQEEVLKLQSLIKLFLMKRREIKKQMNNDFNKFCLDRYAIPMAFPDTLDEDEDNIAIDDVHSDSLRSLVEDPVNTRGTTMGAELQKYKKLLIRERKQSKLSQRYSKIAWK